MAQMHKDGKDTGEIKSLTGQRNVKMSGEGQTNKQILATMASLGHVLRYNQVLTEIERNGEPLTDGMQCEIFTQMHKQGVDSGCKLYKSRTWMDNAIKSVEVNEAYDPFAEYFLKAHYKFLDFAKDNPEASPLKILSDALKVKIPDEAIDANIDWKYECLKYWLCGAIAKVKCGFQNWMLVLQGRQGVGKSLLARRLGRVIGDRYFAAGPIDPRNKDHVIRRSTTFVWEAEELDGTINFSESAHLKAFLTQDTAKERAPHGHFARIYKSRCSFIGTVNTTEFLKDPTGNRRFLCMELLGIDKDIILGMDMDLVWGEAAYLLENVIDTQDGHINLPQEIIDIQNNTNEDSRVKTALEIALDARIRQAQGKSIGKEQLRALLRYLDFQHGLYPVAHEYMISKGFEFKKSVKISKNKTTTGYYGCEIIQC